MNTNVSFLSRSKLLLVGSALLLSSMFFGQQASAAFCTWTASSSQLASTLTNWEDTIGGVGAACTTLTGKDLFFNGARTTTNAVFDVSTTTAGISMDSTYTGTININSGVTLTGTGSFAQDAGTFQVGGTLAVVDLRLGGTAFNATGTINVSGNVNVTTTLSQTVGTLTMSGLTKTISGPGSINFYNLTIADDTTLGSSVTTTNDLTVNSLRVFDLSTFNLNVGGSILSPGTLIQTSGTVTMTGTGKLIGDSGITSGRFVPYNLTINGSVTLSTAGTSNVTTTNILTIGSSGSLTGHSGSTINLPGTSTPFVRNGTFVPSGSTVKYSGATATIASTTYYNLTVDNGTSGTLSGSTTVSSVLTINASKTLDTSSFTLNLSGTGTPLVKTGTLTSNGVVRYSGVGATNVAANLTYYGLQIDSTAAVLAGIVEMNNLVISSGAVLDANGYTISLLGITPFTQSGTFTASTSTVVYGGGSTQPITSASYYNLLISTAGTLAGNVTTTNVLTVSSTKSLDANGYTLALTGTSTPFLRNGTFTASTSTVVFSGATANVASTTYYNLTLNGATSNTITGSTTVNNLFTVGTPSILEPGIENLTLAATGTPFVNNTGASNFSNLLIRYTGNGVNMASGTFYTVTVDSASSTVYGGLQAGGNTGIRINSGAVFNAGTSTLEVTGNNASTFINNGTFNAGSSTFTYSNSVTGPDVASTTYFNLVINNAGTALLTGSTTVSNVLTVNASKVLDASSYTLTLSGTGIPLVNNGTFTASTSIVVYSGATATIASTTYYNLTVDNGTAGTLGGYTTVSNVLTINSGKTLDANGKTLTFTGTGTPLLSNGTFTASTSTVVFSGATSTIASTTYWNLVVNNGTSGTLSGSTTVSNVLTINSGKTLNGSSFTLTFPSSTTAFVNSGTFTSASSTVRYTGTGSVTPAAERYWGLVLGAGTYTLAGNTTSTDSITNAGSLTIGSSYTLYAPGTFTNTGTVTETGAIVHPLASVDFVDGAGTAASTYATAASSVYLKVVDTDANLTTSADTMTVTVTSDTYSDSETITLTETGASTGIFQSSGNIFSVASAKTNNDGLFQVSGNGTVSLAFTDSKDSTDTGSDSATFTGNTVSVSSGSSGGGGGVTSGAGSAPSKVSVSLPGNPSSVSSRNITINLSAFNAKDMIISEDSAFVGAVWELYATTKVFALSAGDGQKTLNIRFRSATGALSTIYQVTVGLKEASALTTLPESSNVGSSNSSNVTIFTLSNPGSKLVILPVKKLQYVPNSSVAYTYSFKNENSATLKIKVARQVLDANGKVVAQVNSSASIAKGKTFKSSASNLLSSKLADGNYTIKVKVMDSKNKLLGENSFDVTVKKPLPPPSISTNNPDSKVVITGLKVDYKPGSAVKYTYSYKNETGKPVKVKIVRQVVDANGKVVGEVDGTRTLSKGQAVKFNATSSLSKKLATGTYTAKVKVLDSKNVVLAENSFDFNVK